jgi:hypothetical protein
MVKQVLEDGDTGLGGWWYRLERMMTQVWVDDDRGLRGWLFIMACAICQHKFTSQYKVSNIIICVALFTHSMYHKSANHTLAKQGFLVDFLGCAPAECKSQTESKLTKKNGQIPTVKKCPVCSNNDTAYIHNMVLIVCPPPRLQDRLHQTSPNQ